MRPRARDEWRVPDMPAVRNRKGEEFTDRQWIDNWGMGDEYASRVVADPQGPGASRRGPDSARTPPRSTACKSRSAAENSMSTTTPYSALTVRCPRSRRWARRATRSLSRPGKPSL